MEGAVDEATVAPLAPVRVSEYTAPAGPQVEIVSGAALSAGKLKLLLPPTMPMEPGMFHTTGVLLTLHAER